MTSTLANSQAFDEEEFTILIVDDISENLQVLSAVLESAGYKMLVANSGASALQVLKRKTPDLILVDVMMSPMNGFELCQQIKSLPSVQNIPVIFISAQTQIAAKLSGFKAGGVDYITKPFEKLEVLARVQAHLLIKWLSADRERQIQKLQDANEKLERLSIHDDLTGLHNRRHLRTVLNAEHERCHRYGGSLGCLLLDIDRFKSINDTYGHEVGDHVLRQFAARIKKALRSVDHSFRFGGEEFLVLLPEVNLQSATVVATRILSACRDEPFIVHEQPHSVTVSIGISHGQAATPKDANDLLAVADKALYTAKENGRDQFSISG